MTLIEQLRAQLDSGFKPEIDGETLQRIVTALEAGKVITSFSTNLPERIDAMLVFKEATK
jgi:hypothetical protein